MPDRRFPDRILVHAVRIHVDDYHRRTLVHHHVRHTPESTAQVGRLRQYNGHRLAVLSGHGSPAADGHQWVFEDKVRGRLLYYVLYNMNRENWPK